MFQFIAYADVHHDNYNNGVTLADTISVEDAITEYAVSHGINNVIFAGDWYRATNPTQDVIKSAEASWKRRSDLGINTFAMPGNHDRWTKSANSGHAFAAADVFKSDLKNIRVFDRLSLIEVGGVKFMFIPAWHETQPIPRIDGDLVVMFHGMITGSKLPGNIDAQGSVDIEMLKGLNAMLLLGGDNHVPQVVEHIPNCYYLGAPLQHTWGDRDQTRGFWHVTIDDHRAILMVVPTRTPRFVRFSVPVSNEIDAVYKIGEHLNTKCDGNPGIVEVTLIGDVGSIDREFIERSILGMGARCATVIIDRSFDRLEIAPAVAQATTTEDKWAAYVSSGVAPGMDGLDPKILNDIGLNAILKAKSI
jgi:DNA repair exonuclease SbcCD nuclease subunit